LSLWTAEEIARAVGGRIDGGFEATGVSIDTRTLEPGDLFVALAGVRDGHEFLEQAFAKGASGALVSRPSAGPAVIVDDVQQALERLGAAARDRAPARRGAVTGSVGKTSVTQAVRAGLELAGSAHSSVKSYNNHIGVPLTLARMPAETQRAVFEIGMNHAGEIAPLSRMVRPHAAVVTTVGPVHVENFADGEAGVARAKSEIFAGLEPGGAAILNADNPWFDLLRAEAEAVGARVLTFGSGETCDARLLSIQDGAVRARIHDRSLDFRLLQSGQHWGPNSLAVLLMLEALGVDLDVGVTALEGFVPLEGRGAERRIQLPAGAFTLIDESYNANPISMAAALKTLGARPAEGRRIAAMTDMLELGPEGPRFHAEVADAVEAADVDLVFCAGPLMKSLHDALPPTRRGGYAETAAALAPRVAAEARPGDLIMVKGSNGSRASLIAQALAALHPSGAA
jgi:UDP-N-acetylmuramoyl-tripeptide--D-alanyl-D-alanine ligase